MDELRDVQVAPPRIPNKPKVVVISVFFFLFYSLLLVFIEIDSELKRLIGISLAMSVAAFGLTLFLVPDCAPYFLRKKLYGFDRNKRGSAGGNVKIPEAMVAVSGITFFTALFLFLYFCFPPDSEWLVEYDAAMWCIIISLLLGFVDDVVDWPVRAKRLVPMAAALPLMIAYSGPTSISIPKLLQGFVGQELLDLGRSTCQFYMALFMVFCSNAINIHAGVNGLEVGQTVMIAIAILAHNILQVQGVVDPKQRAHAAFSIYFTQPLLGSCLGLLAFNWYPSAVFVGDSFTYIAGVALAVVGILGHFSWTLLLLFVPQILHFVYSGPQLQRLVPIFDPRTGLLTGSQRLVPIFDPRTGLLTGSQDLILVNLFLRWFGSCTEQQLCVRLLSFQVFCCALGFLVRYILTGW